MRSDSNDDKRLAGLRAYHARRPAITRMKLMEALDRMETNTTVVIPSNSKPNQKNLALEAVVSESTLTSKDPKTGARKFADVLARLHEIQKSKVKVATPEDYADQKIKELREENQSMREDRYNQAIEIDKLGVLLLKKDEEIKRLEEIESQNAQLREEIRLMKYQQPKRIK